MSIGGTAWKAKALNVIAGAGALVWMSGGPVAAADIPAAPVYKAPVAAPVAQNWYGFFIGVSGGYAWGRNGVDVTAGVPLTPFAVGTTFASNPTGGLGGLQWGSNWQFNRIVLGTIGDIYISDIKASQTISATVGAATATATIDQHLKWFGTTRLRGGVLLTDNFLVYASGGLASGRGQSSLLTTTTIGCPAIGCPFGTGSKNMWGWAGGGGVEWMGGPWSLRAEYLHYDLGTLSYPIVVPAPLVANASARMAGDMVLGTISYKFNWTPFGILFGTDHF